VGGLERCGFVALNAYGSDFYSQLSYANAVGLIVIFTCILPVIVIASGTASYFTVTRPAREIADCMRSVAGEKEGRRDFVAR
jgi:hypothetical protein